VTIVADGHHEAGLGHLSRSTAIAVALRSRGVAVASFVHGREEPLKRDGVYWAPFEAADLPVTDVLVVDSYRLAATELASFASDAPLVLLHDFDDPPAPATLVVSVAPGVPESSGRRLTGLEYAALRPMFWGLPKRTLRREAASILVTTGAGTLGAVGRDIAAEVAAAIPDGQVVLVRGPNSTVDAPDGVELLDAPESLLDALLAADVVISAGGQTMLEAAATGTPCIALALVENQIRQVEVLARIGVVRVVDPVNAASAAEAARELALDTPAREALSERAQNAVDGYGALRIAFEITRLIGRQG
jgi:UDP-2,4-diacetamido-2,4,6-trideoxy-beta-L-altropyranose hydrolase